MGLLHALVVEDSGVTAIEYALLASLIVVVCVAAIGSIGTTVNIFFVQAATAF